MSQDITVSEVFLIAFGIGGNIVSKAHLIQIVLFHASAFKAGKPALILVTEARS